MIRNICFDLDGVLISPTCFKNFKAHIISLTDHSEKIDEVFHGAKMNDFKRGLVGEVEFWEYADSSLGLQIGMQGYYEQLKRHYVLQAEVVNLIHELRSKGKQISICTNNFQTRIRAAQDATGFLDLIDIPIISYEVGSLKPEKCIYQELIDKSGCEPNEIFYSDDNEDKLQGAIDLGIHCAVVRDQKELFDMIKNL